MLRLFNAFNGKEVVLVTYGELFTKELQSNTIFKKYLLQDLTLKFSEYRGKPILNYFVLLLHMMLLCVMELKIFWKEKPEIVISTGSEIALPMFFLAKVFRKKRVFIESSCRVKELSGTGKIVYPISDVFIVQWPYLLSRYKRAVYKGNILLKQVKKFEKRNDKSSNNKRKMVFVDVGTAPFDRLIRKMDEIAPALNARVMMKIAKTKYNPRNVEYFTFLPRKQLKDFYEKADVIICHGGVGSIINALETRARIIAVPRLTKYFEHFDDHQLEIVRALDKRKVLKAVYDLYQLPEILKQQLDQKPESKLLTDTEVKDEFRLHCFLRDLINRWEKMKSLKEHMYTLEKSLQSRFEQQYKRSRGSVIGLNYKNYSNVFPPGGHEWERTLGVRKRVSFILSNLKLSGGCRVLDVGCGAGHYIRTLPWRFVGIDILDRGSRDLPRHRADFVLMSAEKLGFRENSFDAAIMIEVLEHVHNDREAIREVSRVLKPCGCLVVSTVNKLFPFESHELLLGSRIVHASGVPLLPHLPSFIRKHFATVRLYTARGLKTILTSEGFLIKKIAYLMPTLDSLSERGFSAKILWFVRKIFEVLEQSTLIKALSMSIIVAAEKYASKDVRTLIHRDR